MEAFMYGPPTYVWAMITAGLTAIGATACITLYGGAMRAGLCRGRAALLAEAMAVPARRLVHRYRGDRGSGLVPHAAVVPGRGGRVPGHAACAQPHPGGGAHNSGSGHGEPPHAAALVPGGRNFPLYLTFGHLPALFAL